MTINILSSRLASMETKVNVTPKICLQQNELTQSSDKYPKSLNDDKVIEIKNMIYIVKKFTDNEMSNTWNDDVNMSQISLNELILDKVPNIISNIYHKDNDTNINSFIHFDDVHAIQENGCIYKMYFNTALHTTKKISLLNTAFVFNKNIKGKSESLIFFSSDFKYCFKTIRKNEFEKLVKELQTIQTYFKNNPTTYLVEYVGIFSLNYNPDICNNEYFVVMKNIFQSPHRFVYDLKGLNVVRKQQTSMGINLNLKLTLSQTQVIQLIKDIDFLNSINVMDYSIVVGCDTTDKSSIDSFDIGIVDTLTEYTFNKKLENIYNILFYESCKSTIDPQKYARRCKTFIESQLSNIVSEDMQ